VDEFTAAERAALAPHFTDLERPVFALVDLPEVVKGALFARYSRSAKSLRRLFLDEFRGDVARPTAGAPAGAARAEQLYEKVFVEYGDDSVAQLGGVHLACEGCSNVLTKVLEWGRLMAYLEQSTRYVPYTDKPGGRYRYHVPEELAGGALAARYARTLDLAFDTYVRWLGPLQEHFARRHPRVEGVPEAAWRRSLRAKALDSLRGLLPAATLGNVGLYGTGQAYEALLLRMRAHPLAEVRRYAHWMLEELRKVIPAFVQRVDRPDRGERATRYLARTRADVAAVAGELLAGIEPEPRAEVELVDFDPQGETEVVAAALYATSRLPDAQLREIVGRMTAAERRRVLAAYVGERENRRHRPGRAFERTGYRFDVLADYGAFRDLQRHRLLTLEWQPLSADHGFDLPAALAEAGAAGDFARVMDESAALYRAIRDGGLQDVAPYAVCMAFRVRFYMSMNAREALHVIELRSGPQGHPAYRRIAQRMHRLIAEQAGHQLIAESMRFVDHSAVELERLAAEQEAERRRQSPSAAG